MVKMYKYSLFILFNFYFKYNNVMETFKIKKAISFFKKIAYYCNIIVKRYWITTYKLTCNCHLFRNINKFCLKIIPYFWSEIFKNIIFKFSTILKDNK